MSGPCELQGRSEPGIEIRRIILLTRLRDTPNGMTMQKLVKDCSRVPGWSVPGASHWDGTRHVLQTLIDDRLVAAKARFQLTEKGREYLADPLRWRIQVETRDGEEAEGGVLWKGILEVFDRAYARLRSTTGSRLRS